MKHSIKWHGKEAQRGIFLGYVVNAWSKLKDCNTDHFPRTKKHLRIAVWPLRSWAHARPRIVVRRSNELPSTKTICSGPLGCTVGHTHAESCLLDLASFNRLPCQLETGSDVTWSRVSTTFIFFKVKPARRNARQVVASRTSTPMYFTHLVSLRLVQANNSLHELQHDVEWF